MTIRLLYNVGSDLKGAVLDVDEGRARQLVTKGYAVPVTVEPVVKKFKREPKPCPPKV